MNEIFVTGHRNPDTDSIVAAISYAALRNALGDSEYRAARIGSINDETARMLERFGFEPPLHIKTMRTQVCDLDFDRPPTLHSTVTMDLAWRTMRDVETSSLPIVDDDGGLFGLLSAGDIASYSMRSITDSRIEALPVFNLLSVLEGKLVNENSFVIETVSGDLRIAVPQAIDEPVGGGRDSILICGDQPEIIAAALEKEINCLIICQSEIRPEWARSTASTCIVSTPLDARTVARLIYLAIPVERVCQKEEIVAFHLADYLDDVREILLKSRFRSYPVLDENERVVGMLSRYHMLRPRRKRVVLVDHNEAAQSVPGLEQVEIMEIIDHHRLADIQTAQPVSVRNEPVGSTNTIITAMYQENGVMPSGGADGRGHPLGHGDVQVAHLHQARYRDGRAARAHRARLARGDRERALLRPGGGGEAHRGAFPDGLQGLPYRRAQHRREPDHLRRRLRSARAARRIHVLYGKAEEGQGFRFRDPDDHGRAAGGLISALCRK